MFALEKRSYVKVLARLPTSLPPSLALPSPSPSLSLLHPPPQAVPCTPEATTSASIANSTP